jgi:N-acetylmuramoyl-L-alanine amidase
MAVEQNSLRFRERYYAARPAAALGVSSSLADVVAEIDSPITKLRFLRDVIDHHRPIPVSFRNRFIQPLGRTALKVTTYSASLARATRQSIRTWLTRLLLLVAVGIAIFAASRLTEVEKLVRTRAATNAAVAATKPSATIEPLAAVAETLPIDTLGVTPTTIWLADHGPNWELYSNGLRIETSYLVKGEPRSYRVHDFETGLIPEVRTKPIGILFHTSESDVWPLDTGFEKQLRQTSEGLLNYVKRQHAYNYVIDRFGRAFRVVDDETRANHAGNSIWAKGNEVYLDMNSAFIGVSFESRWEGGKTLPITRAQLIAGRNLTNYLRQRFAIAPEMCVTHGLVSVSPKQYLIGYHLDWARGFPFAAFGLPDQYAVTPPSLKFFGFNYNADFVRAVGTGWPGALSGKTEFAQAAAARGITPEALRSERRALYRKWTTETHADAADSDDIDTINLTDASH